MDVESTTTTANLSQKSSSENTKALEDNIVSLTEDGKKAFALHDYELAIAKFGEASDLLGKQHGEESTQYADSLVLYGRALLENAIAQSSVFGNDALPKNTEDSNAMPLEVPLEKKQKFQFEGEPNFGEDEIDEDEEMTDAEPSAEAEDHSDDLSVAWESLDAARVIYSKTDVEEAKTKLGDVYIALETFDQAVNDYREALNIKLKICSEEDPLALELSTSEQDLAVDHVQKAIEVLEKRKVFLSTQLNGIKDQQQQQDSGKGKGIATDQTGRDDDNTTKVIKKELNEIEDFLVEMNAKAEDMRIAKIIREQVSSHDQLFNDLLKSAVNQETTTSTSSSSTETSPSKSKSVNDLTSLIKRKQQQQ
ncbi:1403_t:CDS:2 [Ambispora gerdemannii]|uniref:1403_t:CDS:1 n=1 Tax=Ambispora gerdemannii TaxID=144530 RepID=A0A9N8ZWG6_9GLOM|nr:1403_t:CDS:2 [Ambispora gerdemannii]